MMGVLCQRFLWFKQILRLCHSLGGGTGAGPALLCFEFVCVFSFLGGLQPVMLV